LFDIIAVVLGYFKVSLLFAIMLLIYGLVSKAYSHPAIRLKRYPYLGWLITGLFQGAFTFLMCYVGINKFNIENSMLSYVLVPAALTSLMLWGNYPMTQIYQHKDDAKRGDITLSLKLGIRGTFIFTALLFGVATLGFIFYFINFYSIKYAYQFLFALSPVLLFFGFWFFKVIRNESNANYGYTMQLNFISATCLNAFFIWFFLDSTHILDVF
jgi:1,4-dihydroxy-2-naphthoate octaprenyltransferase